MNNANTRAATKTTDFPKFVVRVSAAAKAERFAADLAARLNARQASRRAAEARAAHRTEGA